MARPKEFEVDEALEAALEAFWDYGYTATSLGDLMERMELNKGSLYSTFGDKHQLFMAALDRYENRGLQLMREILERPGSVKLAIREWLATNFRNCDSKEGFRGCFHYNTILEMFSHDETIAQRIKQHVQIMERQFCKALERGKAQGEFSPDLNVAVTTRYLLNVNAGLSVMGKFPSTQQEFEALLDVIVSVLK